MNLTPIRFLCPVIGDSAPLMTTESFCPKWTKSLQGKRLRFGVIGPKPYFFVKNGEIKGSDKLMAGYLSKRLGFEYELVRPKGAFSGMVSAVTSTLM